MLGLVLNMNQHGGEFAVGSGQGQIVV